MPLNDLFKNVGKLNKVIHDLKEKQQNKLSLNNPLNQTIIDTVFVLDFMMHLNQVLIDYLHFLQSTNHAETLTILEELINKHQNEDVSKMVRDLLEDLKRNNHTLFASLLAHYEVEKNANNRISLVATLSLLAALTVGSFACFLPGVVIPIIIIIGIVSIFARAVAGEENVRIREDERTLFEINYYNRGNYNKEYLVYQDDNQTDSRRKRDNKVNLEHSFFYKKDQEGDTLNEIVQRQYEQSPTFDV